MATLMALCSTRAGLLLPGLTPRLHFSTATKSTGLVSKFKGLWKGSNQEEAPKEETRVEGGEGVQEEGKTPTQMVGHVPRAEPAPKPKKIPRFISFSISFLISFFLNCF